MRHADGRGRPAGARGRRRPGRDRRGRAHRTGWAAGRDGVLRPRPARVRTRGRRGPPARRPAPGPPVLHHHAAQPGPAPVARQFGAGSLLNRPEVGRAFVALKPPENVLDAVAAAVSPARSVREGLRWEHRERYHLTLQFLGPVPELAPVVGALAAAAWDRE